MPIDLGGQLSTLLVKKEVARSATIARTRHWFLTHRAHNSFTMIFFLFIQNQWMILVGKLMCLTINFQKTRLKSTFDIKIKLTERTMVNKTVASFAAPIIKASCFIRWLCQ
jgi:hypothetical protein